MNTQHTTHTKHTNTHQTHTHQTNTHTHTHTHTQHTTTDPQSKLDSATKSVKSFLQLSREDEPDEQQIDLALASLGSVRGVKTNKHE